MIILPTLSLHHSSLYQHLEKWRCSLHQTHSDALTMILFTLYALYLFLLLHFILWQIQHDRKAEPLPRLLHADNFHHSPCVSRFIRLRRRQQLLGPLALVKVGKVSALSVHRLQIMVIIINWGPVTASFAANSPFTNPLRWVQRRKPNGSHESLRFALTLMSFVRPWGVQQLLAPCLQLPPIM